MQHAPSAVSRVKKSFHHQPCHQISDRQVKIESASKHDTVFKLRELSVRYGQRRDIRQPWLRAVQYAARVQNEVQTRPRATFTGTLARPSRRAADGGAWGTWDGWHQSHWINPVKRTQKPSGKPPLPKPKSRFWADVACVSASARSDSKKLIRLVLSAAVGCWALCCTVCRCISGASS